MAEVVLELETPVRVGDDVYEPRACGRERDDGTWEGWIELTTPDGRVYRTPRETTQPNEADLRYWATGLTRVYLEGAVQRALEAPSQPRTLAIDAPSFGEPAPAPSRRAS